MAAAFDDLDLDDSDEDFDDFDENPPAWGKPAAKAKEEGKEESKDEGCG